MFPSFLEICAYCCCLYFFVGFFFFFFLVPQKLFASIANIFIQLVKIFAEYNFVQYVYQTTKPET